MKKWKCSVCNYVHEGDNPPGACPQCESVADVFFEISIEEESSEEVNTQKNTE